jgi:hypothetical protein
MFLAQGDQASILDQRVRAVLRVLFMVRRSTSSVNSLATI